MPQDRESGARARAFGYQMGQRVALAIGATLTNPGQSNEAIWDTRRILIKSAHRGVPEIGATDATLARIEAIVVALQDQDGDYSMYQVTPEWFREEMHPSRSPRAAHLMMVRCNRVRQDGIGPGRIGDGF